MTAASKPFNLHSIALQGHSLSQTATHYGEADALREETDKGTEGKGRGKGPSTYTRTMEITPGTTIYQQGIAATCKDPLTEGEPEAVGGIW